MFRKLARVGSTVAMALSVLAMSAVAALATPSPVESIMTEANDVVTTNVPLIAAGLATLLAVALGIRALWTAYANAKKGVSQMK